MKYSNISKIDTLIYEALIDEERRQKNGLELIPSENYVSEAVLEALGSYATNKYSEGYPYKKYYGGQEYMNVIETIAIDRACKLFKCKYANVQPLSGAPANLATYFALLKPGDTILGMDLSHGGHLTHGHPATAATKVFNFVTYKMKNIETGEIDYKEIYKLAKLHKPKVILLGFSAYPRNLDYSAFAQIAKDVGAVTVADMAHIAGLIAGKALSNPFDYGIDIITTTTHKTLRGPRGGMILIRESKELFDKINKAVFPGLQGGPHMNNIAAKAICLKEASTPAFRKYAKQVLKNAKAMETVFIKRNVKMITGGTDNHLILIDTLTSFGMSGKYAEKILDLIGVTVNKNIIPNDTLPASDPSGIRIGTPAITSRGFTIKECTQLANIICDILYVYSGTIVQHIPTEVELIEKIEKLTKQFPIKRHY